MGIGRFHLVDGDSFEAHNLNRQLLSNIGRIGMQKAKAAVLHVQTINPGLEVTSTADYLRTGNADTLLNSCDLVVDCLDNIPFPVYSRNGSQTRRRPHGFLSSCRYLRACNHNFSRRHRA
jgi:molybdopterin/thiamine biosynthesis adenylyltransferase